MIITYYGGQATKLRTGDTIIATNPVSKDSKSKIKPSKFGANVVLVSAHHPDYNGIDTVTYGDKEPFVISGPGEYEKEDIFFIGGLANTHIDGVEYINTIYSFVFDDIKIAFLGNMDSREISADTREKLGDADVVFVSLENISASDAYKLASSFTPSLIIPMEYDNETLEKFLKEAGSDVKSIDKLTIKKKDLIGKDGVPVVLSY